MTDFFLKLHLIYHLSRKFVLIALSYFLSLINFLIQPHYFIFQLSRNSRQFVNLLFLLLKFLFMFHPNNFNSLLLNIQIFGLHSFFLQFIFLTE